MSFHLGSTAPSGTLTLKRLHWPAAVRDGGRWLALATILKHTLPWPGNPSWVNVWRLKNLPNVWRGLWRALLASIFGIPTHFGALWLRKVDELGNMTPLGLASLRVVTTNGANYIRDSFLNTVEPENQKFHGFGSGTTAEAVGDTALVTEYTTEYATDNTRPTGSQASNGAGIYRTVATFSPDATVTVAEHGIFSQAATGGGTLLDRSKFTGVPLTGSADSLQATYDFTITAGS